MSELPKDCAAYITDELGWTLDDVVAHRIVHGEEPKYVVLMRDDRGGHFTVGFVGRYSARRPLGDYEEAHPANARRDGWDCLWDAGEWEHPVGRFRNAPASIFEGS